MNTDALYLPTRMLKKTGRQGRSEQRDEAYFFLSTLSLDATRERRWRTFSASSPRPAQLAIQPTPAFPLRGSAYWRPDGRSAAE
jgi:hypothetical protein